MKTRTIELTDKERQFLKLACAIVSIQDLIRVIDHDELIAEAEATEQSMHEEWDALYNDPEYDNDALIKKLADE